MIAANLIQLLETMPPHMEVMIDVTPTGSKMIVLSQIDTVEELTTTEGEEYVLLCDSRTFTEEEPDETLGLN